MTDIPPRTPLPRPIAADETFPTLTAGSDSAHRSPWKGATSRVRRSASQGWRAGGAVLRRDRRSHRDRSGGERPANNS